MRFRLFFLLFLSGFSGASAQVACHFNRVDIPRDFTANPVVLSEYLSEMGKIQGRAQTYLTAKNQRLLGKTIRRAKMMGIIPNLSILTSVDRTSKLRRR